MIISILSKNNVVCVFTTRCVILIPLLLQVQNTQNFLNRMFWTTLSHCTIDDESGELRTHEDKEPWDMSSLNMSSSYDPHKDIRLSVGGPKRCWTMYYTTFVSTICFCLIRWPGSCPGVTNLTKSDIQLHNIHIRCVSDGELSFLAPARGARDRFLYCYKFKQLKTF